MIAKLLRFALLQRFLCVVLGLALIGLGAGAFTQRCRSSGLSTPRRAFPTTGP